ncbi:efflux RND transporter permease subunit [Cellulomonas sp. Leaf395]|uniref:efflux RND transporter permease subunit n=1 Tax=Cellulomonas sp. Leaf395 TaxID=1736362 RepID=UPI0006F39647|nr:efflux RND transporter permease subunit [Cellulomonas sp. Leaf395]KQT02357.1 hydrogenase expression protein [Cellulomonas sp. Leaf395]
MSRLARLSLANRSVVALLTIAIAVFGWISLGSLKQELIPSLQIPTAVVVAVDPGSSPQLVEQQVTVPVEQAVRAVDGVEEVTSTSSTGLSTTTVELTYGGDLDASAQALQQAVDRVRTSLPTGVEPTVFTGSLDDFPVVQLAISGGEGMDDAELATLVQDTVVPRFEQIDGVREVTVTGVSDDAVTVTLDLPALAGTGLSPASVATILQDNGVVLPTGTVDEGDTTLSVQVGSELSSVEDLESLPLVGANPPVTLDDVAEVTVAPVTATSFSRLDGEPALAVSLTKTPDGNTVEVSHGARDAVEELEAQLGDDVQVAVVFDQAPFIEESIEGLATEGALGLLFAVLVILLFLGSVRSTLVSAISIPLSLLVTFAGLQLGGYSLNILTLGALTIAIGRVVDDSIVVIENIKRHRSYGEAKTTAILTAVREVAGAITASTVTTVAVFLPIALVGGMVGELFRPFAITVAIAMTASLFVALTIVPVLAYWFIKDAPRALSAQAEPDAVARDDAEERERHGFLQRSYLATLRPALRHPVITLGAAFLIFVGTIALVPRLETNFLGDSGQDTLTVTEAFAPGTSLAAQDASAQEVEQALMAVDGVTTVQTTVGSSGGPEAAFTGGSGTPRATFALTLDADADPEVVQEDVRAATSELGDVTVAGGGAAFGSSTVDVVVRSDDPDQLAELAQEVQTLVEGVDGTSDVTNNLAAAQPTVQVVVDRAAAAEVGLTETQVAGTVAAVMSPRPVGTVDLGDGPLDVTIEATAGPATLDELRAVVLPTATGLVPLAQVASIDEVDVPTSVTRVDGERSATVSATPTGQDLGALTTDLQAQLDDLDVPAGASVAIGGVATDQQDAFADLGVALLVAIAIVYLVMVATFRSLLQPVILLVSVPFAATGAILALLLTGTPLGVPALIGVLMLVGIVVTNAIVLIDLVNQYRRAGSPLAEAVTEGARKRLRPILMTALATIFALTPMAFGITGGGVFISKPLAIVVIGGLVTSTLLTLLLVPVLYTLAEKARGRGEQRRAHKATVRTAEA